MGFTKTGRNNAITDKLDEIELVLEQKNTAIRAAFSPGCSCIIMIDEVIHVNLDIFTTLCYNPYIGSLTKTAVLSRCGLPPDCPYNST